MPALKQSWLNLVIDHRYRAQAITIPATWYIGLFNVIPTRSASGTEISTGAGYTGYARQSIACSLANWSGTQGAGTTTASSGTNDYITNNVDITFSASLAAAWSGLVGFGLFDAVSGGNHREWGEIVDSGGNAITVSRAIGEPVIFEAGQLRLYIR